MKAMQRTHGTGSILWASWIKWGGSITPKMTTMGLMVVEIKMTVSAKVESKRDMTAITV